jgi:hypothetical protein
MASDTLDPTSDEAILRSLNDDYLNGDQYSDVEVVALSE